MFYKKYGDFVLGVFFIILAAAMYIMSCALPPSLMGGLGSEFMPKLLSVGIAVLSVFQIAAGFKIMKNYQPEAEAEAEEDKPEYGRVMATILSFGIYVFVLNLVGFLISSALYLFAQICILAPKEKRNYLLFAVISVLVTVVVYFIFRNGLSVMLPVGILG